MKDSLPKTPLSFIWWQAKCYKLYCFGFLIVGALWAVDLSLRPYLIKVMLDRLEHQPADLVQYLIVPAASYIALSFLMNGVLRFSDYLGAKLFPELMNAIVLKCIQYVQLHSHSYFMNQFGGSIVSCITDLAESTSDIIDKIFNRLYSHSLAIVSACFALPQANKGLPYILLGWTTIFIVASFILAQRAHDISYEVSEAHTTLKGRLLDSISNMLVVRIFARKDYEYQYISWHSQKKKEKTQKLLMMNLKQKALMETAANILIAIVISYLIYKRQRGEVTIGDFTLSITISLAIVGAIWNVAEDFLDFFKDMGIIKQTLNMIAVPHEIRDEPDASELVVSQGAVEVQDLTFRYKSDTSLFENLSLYIPAQQKVGLVGFSGSGKTTFANLLIRLYDIQGGQILIDQQDIKKVTQESLHRNITYIPQEPLLFHRTIMENIRYGRPEATDEEVIEAARKAHADEFINDIPGGYETMVGERGVKLSGGQRQRIAIARAILKNSRILILDEATSALDSLTEYYIQQSLSILMQDKTVFVIAHRLSTILEMDRILVFDKGHIIQDGPPKQLMYEPGLFSQLLTMQGCHRDVLRVS
jgi:ATP-binding cassette subfamily B protein